MRVRAPEFLHVVSQATNGLSHNKAIFRLCTRTVNTETVSQLCLLPQESPVIEGHQGLTAANAPICSLEHVTQRKHDHTVPSMIVQATAREQPITAESRFADKSQLWRALGHKVSGGRFLTCRSAPENAVENRGTWLKTLQVASRERRDATTAGPRHGPHHASGRPRCT